MIPSLATQALVSGIRMRPYTHDIGSQNESGPRVVNLSGELLLANQARAFGIRKRPYTKNLGSHAEYMIPSLATRALVYGIRRRPYTTNIGSQDESEPRAVNLSGESVLATQASESDPIRQILDPTRDI